MKRTIAALSTLPFLAVPTAASAGGGCHSEGPAQETPATRIVVQHSCYSPTVASVAPGTKVTFVNDSGMAHNLTGPAVEFTEMPAGSTIERTFDSEGIYVFACTIHPGMSGAVVVRAAGAGNAAAAPAVPASNDTSASGLGTPALALAALAVLAAGALVLRNFSVPGVTPRTR